MRFFAERRRMTSGRPGRPPLRLDRQPQFAETVFTPLLWGLCGLYFKITVAMDFAGTVNSLTNAPRYAVWHFAAAVETTAVISENAPSKIRLCAQSASLTVTSTVSFCGVKNGNTLKRLLCSGKNPMSNAFAPTGIYFEKCAIA